MIPTSPSIFSNCSARLGKIGVVGSRFHRLLWHYSTRFVLRFATAYCPAVSDGLFRVCTRARLRDIEMERLERCDVWLNGYLRYRRKFLSLFFLFFFFFFSRVCGRKRKVMNYARTLLEALLSKLDSLLRPRIMSSDGCESLTASCAWATR